MFQCFEYKKLEDDQILIYNYQIKEHKLSFTQTFTNKWLTIENWSIIDIELSNIAKKFFSENSDYSIGRKFIRNLPGDLSITVSFNEVTPSLRDIFKLDNNNAVLKQYLIAIVEYKYVTNKFFTSSTIPVKSDTISKQTLDKPINSDRLIKTRKNSKEYSPSRSDLNKALSYTPLTVAPILQTNKQGYIPTPKHKAIIQDSYEYVPRRKNSDNTADLKVSYTPTKISKIRTKLCTQNDLNEPIVDEHNSISNNDDFQREHYNSRKRNASKKLKTDNSKLFENSNNVTVRKNSLHAELFETINKPISDTDTNKYDCKSLRANLPRKSKPEYSLKEDGPSSRKLIKRKDKHKILDINVVKEEKINEQDVEISNMKESKVPDTLNISYSSQLDQYRSYLNEELSSTSSKHEISMRKTDEFLATLKDEEIYGREVSVTCKHLSNEDISSYYYEFEKKIQELFQQYDKRTSKFKPIEELSFLFVHDVFHENQLRFMLDLLYQAVGEDKFDYYSDVIYHKILPEWTLEIYTTVHNMTREEAIQYIKTEVPCFEYNKASIL